MDDQNKDNLNNEYFKFIPPVILAIAAIFMIAYIIIPDKEYSENENRYLQQFPEVSAKSIFAGKWMKDFDDYLCDQFPMRDNFIGLKTSFEKLTFHTKINDIYLCDDGYYIVPYKKPTATKKIIKRINSFTQSINKDTDVALMLVPTAVTVYKDKLPAFTQTYNQLDTIKEIYNSVTCDTIDAATPLINHKNQDNLYYHLDHHWTIKGAYYGYDAYCKWAGIKEPSMDSYDYKEVTDSFKGTIYSKINDYSVTGDKMWAIQSQKQKLSIKYPDGTKTDSLYVREYLEKKDKYSFYLGNDTNDFIEIHNENASGDEKLVIIKDSYANSLIPYLTDNYSTIYVINPRYYRNVISQFVNENNISKVLLLFNMNTIDTETGIGMIF